VLVFWQSVLADARPEGTPRHWPAGWRPARDFVRGAGPVQARAKAGSDYLTSETAFADLSNTVAFEPDNVNSPLGTRPTGLSKRLYPLDSMNRTFALSVAFRVSAGHCGPLRIESVRPATLPAIPLSRGGEDGCIPAHEFVTWVASLRFRLRGQPSTLSALASVVAAHLADHTSSDGSPAGLTVLGHALYVQHALQFVPEPDAGPGLIVEQVGSIPGRPYIMIADDHVSGGLQRSARVFMLRTVAEIEIANWLTTLEYGGARLDRWARERQKDALRFLQRKNPHGYSGAVARRLWYLSVLGNGERFGQAKKLAQSRLADRLASYRPEAFPDRSVFIMGDTYNIRHAEAVGPGAHVTNTVLNLLGLTVDGDRLASELRLLQGVLYRHGRPEEARALEGVITATQAADAQLLESRLKRVSRIALQAARDLGVDLAAAVIERVTGLH
jgi:hypothetical protein